MISLVIPGYKELTLRYLVLDFNGTIALDGQIFPEVPPLLEKLAETLEIFVLTADTFGTAASQCANLPVRLHCLQSTDHTQEKGAFVSQLGSQYVVTFGNGQNDLAMLQNAALSIGIIAQEGCATSLWQATDLLVPGISPGLELLIYPKRLIATLRK